MKAEHVELLRVEEVAARFKSNPETVRRKIRRGEIPAVRLGTSPRSPLRVLQTELEAWLDASRVGPGRPA